MPNARRLLLSLLIVASALLDLAVVALLSGLTPNDLPAMFYGLAFAQVTWAAAWTGLGGWPRLAGLALTILAAAGLSGAGLCLSVPDGTTRTMLLFASLAASTLLVSLGARAAGLAIETVEDASDRSGGEPGYRQFTLRQMLGAMAVLAVVLGLLRYLIDFPAVPGLGDWGTLGFELASLCGSSSVLALAVIGCVLWRCWRRVFLPVLLAAVGLSIAAITFISTTDLPFAAMFCLCQVGWLLAATAALRVAGYRTRWARRRGAEGGPDRAEVPASADGDRADPN